MNTESEMKTETMEPQEFRYKLPRDPNRAMQEMMGTIDRLRASLIEETAALRDADTKTFLSLQDNKLDVARDYLDGMTQLLSRKEELRSADPTLRQKLEDMRIDFADIAHENHAALERMKNGMKRLGERIMETARETARKEQQIVYGASGQMQSSMKASTGINESA